MMQSKTLLGNQRDRMNERLLVIEQGEPLAREYIPKTLKQLGYRTTLLNELPNVWGKEYYEKVILTRLRNWPYIAQTIQKEHQQDPFSGVFCYNEGAVPLANRLARLLKLPVISKYCSDAFRHKDRMRLVWESYGVRIPRYRILHQKKGVYALSGWQFPVILKPASQMGSHAVIRVESLEEAAARIDLPFAADLRLDFNGEIHSLNNIYGIHPTVLAEEYIDGDEFSAEGLVANGEYRLLGITKKYTLATGSYFDETAHLFPWNDFNPSTWEKIQFQLQLAHQALGIQSAFTHTEFKIRDEEPILIELGARLGGDHIPQLVDHALGIQTIALAARLACNRLALSELEPASNCGVTGILFISAPPSSYGQIFERVKLRSDHGVNILEMKSYYSEGERIPVPLAWGDTRLGHIMFESNDEAAAQTDLRQLQRCVEVLYRQRESGVTA